jgi:PQQ-like domain
VAEPAVIDLGTDFEPVEWVRRPPPVWWRRGWALIGYGALVLLLLGAPAPAAPRLLVPVAAIPAGGSIAHELSSNTLYAAWFPYQAPMAGTAQLEPSRATLDAYRLSDGRLRWRVVLPVDLGSLLIRAAGPDTVVVSSLDLGATGDRTVAYDAASGRLLWDSRLPLVPTVPVGDTVVLGAYLRPGEVPDGSPYVRTAGTGTPPPLLLQALRVRTGTVAWSVRVPAGSFAALPGMTAFAGTADPYAVVIAPDGRARSVDLLSGALTASARVQLGSTRGSEDEPVLLVTGPWLLVGYLQGGRPTLASYRAATLRPQWTGPVRSLNLVAAQCGKLTCLSDELGTRALDLATGRVRWSAMAWPPLGTLGGWVYASLQDERGVSASLLAPDSGTPVLSLAGWALVPGPPRGPFLVHTTGPDQLVDGPGAAWLGVLRATATGPRVEPIGPLVNLSLSGCRAVPEFVVCGAGDGRLLVWRYRG